MVSLAKRKTSQNHVICLHCFVRDGSSIFPFMFVSADNIWSSRLFSICIQNMIQLIRTPEFWVVTFSMNIFFFLAYCLEEKQKEPGHTAPYKTKALCWKNSPRKAEKQHTHTHTQHHNSTIHIHARALTQKSCKLQREATKEWICYNIFIFNTATRIFGKMRKKTRIRALKLNR